MSAPAAPDLLDWAREVQAIAQNGLTFTRDPFDRERYTQLAELVADTTVRAAADSAVRTARAFWEGERGYATPKVDVRGGIFDGERVLLVRERADGRWTLPGGWVDVNDAPSEAVAREVFEESGFRARAVKLAALVDKNRHPHPPGRASHLQAVLRLRAHRRGGGAEQRDRRGGVLPGAALPQLSTGRVLASQIERLYEHRLDPGLPTDFD